MSTGSQAGGKENIREVFGAVSTLVTIHRPFTRIKQAGDYMGWLSEDGVDDRTVILHRITAFKVLKKIHKSRVAALAVRFGCL